MTHSVAEQMRQLAQRLEADLNGLRAELTEFPSGGAMLDVRIADGRAFVMAYSPSAGFGVDELRADDGFGTEYEFVADEFEKAEQQIQQLLSTNSDQLPQPVSLNLVVVYTHDIEAAMRFYGCLGLKFQSEQHGTGPTHFAAMVGEAVLEIYPSRNDGEHSAVRLGFHVPSVEQIVNELRTRGNKILSEPQESPWGRRAVVEDPDGNRVELTQPAARLVSV